MCILCFNEHNNPELKYQVSQTLVQLNIHCFYIVTDEFGKW